MNNIPNIKSRYRTVNAFVFGCALAASSMALPCSASEGSTPLWDLAQKNESVIRLSTLFTAQNVRDYLTSAEGLNQAVQWCKDTAVTHVYLESFRDGYTAEKDTLLRAKKRFSDEGMLVSGCITTTGLGRDSVNGWNFPCFTDPETLTHLQQAFEYAASMFDEIMIDDFLATTCECDDCKKSRGERSWSDFRCDLMANLSRTRILEPARTVNPKVKVIIKYPQWYDDFHKRGYDVDRQTAMFDKIWVGTETRDPDSSRWGRKPQYEGYFLMRWLGGIGQEKCGGGWFDPYGTSPPTYLEQARQTVLAGAKEVFLFCYGALQSTGGKADVGALRNELPGLFKLAALVRGKEIRGIEAPKMPNSDGGGDAYIFDYIGMLGLPLIPVSTIDDNAESLFLSEHSLSDPLLTEKLEKLNDGQTPILMTRNLARRLPEEFLAKLAHVTVIDIPKEKWDLMDIPVDKLDAIRNAVLAPLKLQFKSPARVALYLFDRDTIAVENFNDHAVKTTLTFPTNPQPKVLLNLPDRPQSLSANDHSVEMELSPRSLVVLHGQFAN